MCQCYKNFQGNDCSERTCGFGYAHTVTPKGDLNMNNVINDQDISSQVYHATYEGFLTGDDHSYMECSNQGLCDRETGDCVCFDGFEGSSCQRASCANSCSGHGTCESISEFASTAGGTLFTNELATDTTYQLWDAKVSYGCRCDPWFTGSDCSQRLCKVGVDPMYYETEQVSYNIIELSSFVNPFRLRFWDYYGESYITDTISSIALSVVESALEDLPNGVIDDVTCTIDNAKTMCSFITNPGALRLPAVEGGNVNIAFTQRGEDESLCPELLPKTQNTVATIFDAGSYLLKIKGEYRILECASAGTCSINVSTDDDVYYNPKQLENDTPKLNDYKICGKIVSKVTSSLDSLGAECKLLREARTTNYVSECSGRGLCDRESGVCTCFGGYTNDNCDRQSIMAF
jgi:hypothetical protein